MLKIVLGFIIGFTLSMLFIGIDLAYDLNSNLVTNIAIATGTCVGTFIVILSFHESKMNRSWEIKKEPLLRLLKVLTDAMEVTNRLSEVEFEKETGINPNADTTIEGQPYERLAKELSYLLKVYEPLFPNYVSDAVKTYIEADKKIDEAVHVHFSVFEAYEHLSREQEKLHKVLLDYVKQIARIKNT
ncbi:hypothetical protein BST55_23930 [Vibrio vulnificus]|uniref:hypothetical protein n=1 Tax=Vibrio TaxID=662 RepID=UPI0006A60B95|nr:MULTISPECIES: hypothetical protein [Vibrio]EGR8992361.1 hypothetical protein [Vibrio vulnificus]KOE04293.1 hypothetical protein ACS82_01065 [Vibrio parahaemolyticus]MCA0785908.1 hypothetical protein [Vibrio vulnificus]MCU8566931.1 hypothetical protein [Vibrio vulnificus]OZS50801.1 hypothetical protein BST51_23980 [Vibrio vulnificus]